MTTPALSMYRRGVGVQKPRYLKARTLESQFIKRPITELASTSVLRAPGYASLLIVSPRDELGFRDSDVLGVCLELGFDARLQRMRSAFRSRRWPQT